MLCFQAEVDFFNEIVPRVSFLTPRPRYAAYDPESCNCIIVLDDMTETAKFLHVTVPSDRAQVERKLQILAELHGKFYGSVEPFVKAFVTFRQGFEGYVGTMKSVPHAPDCL